MKQKKSSVHLISAFARGHSQKIAFILWLWKQRHLLVSKRTFGQRCHAWHHCTLASRV